MVDLRTAGCVLKGMVRDFGHGRSKPERTVDFVNHNLSGLFAEDGVISYGFTLDHVAIVDRTDEISVDHVSDLEGEVKEMYCRRHLYLAS